jgi:lipid A ethanolaminephosphotransferase
VRHWLKEKRVSREALILLVCLFLSLFHNLGFFRKVVAAYPLSLGHGVFLLSLWVVLTGLSFLLFSLLAVGRALKPVLLFALVLASLISFMTNSFGVVADETMILNMVKTDPGEIRDLLGWKLFAYVFLLGILPAAGLWLAKVKQESWRRALFLRARSVGVATLIVAAAVALNGKFYASFFREHKEIRSYINPAYSIYSAAKFVAHKIGDSELGLVAFGRDSKVPPTDTDRELIILVVGETARADHFSLNGYGKETNPLLKQEGVVSLKNMWSCGTSTAVSVPCMFSAFGREGYSDRKGQSTENLLDVLANTKRVSVLWRDNNSDSKGVAVRVPYEDFKEPRNNPICDEECRDEGMLSGLQAYIDGKKDGDIFIVLHQMGNHGPAYYKRYPRDFEQFKPACRTNELSQCSAEEISNAYDNAILYTDYFLSKVIGLLKQNSAKFETAMMYVSDHGESLGEHGIYLHGLPYMIAPEAQKRPAAVVWLGEALRAEIDEAGLKSRAGGPLSHDNVFHSILGFFEVDTKVYRKDLDIFH